jgi:SAM-dependent methyltransferase
MSASWKVYYAKTNDREPSSALQKAVSLLPQAGEKTAVDLGCGAGIETRFLLEQGFRVTAVDQQTDMREYLLSLPSQQCLQIVHTPFEAFSFGCYDLIHARHSLPFLAPELFLEIWRSIQGALNLGGVFVGTFFGTHDGWWQAHHRHMTFLERAQVEALTDRWHIIDLTENENDAKTPLGEEKHWHIFHVTAQYASV